MWIAVSPVSIDTDYKVEKNSEEKVVVTLMEQFNFPSNKGAKVRISKWTGKDCLSSLVVKPQVIELQEENQMELTVENPYYDRGIKLLKHDKIGCLSILSTPVPRSMRSNSPDRFQTSEARWVKVTHAVLHRKGTMIPPYHYITINITITITINITINIIPLPLLKSHIMNYHKR